MRAEGVNGCSPALRQGHACRRTARAPPLRDPCASILAVLQ
jgi:hypothetical protein